MAHQSIKKNTPFLILDPDLNIKFFLPHLPDSFSHDLMSFRSVGEDLEMWKTAAARETCLGQELASPSRVIANLLRR
jgi:hypothetical protein